MAVSSLKIFVAWSMLGLSSTQINAATIQDSIEFVDLPQEVNQESISEVSLYLVEELESIVPNDANVNDMILFDGWSETFEADSETFGGYSKSFFNDQLDFTGIGWRIVSDKGEERLKVSGTLVTSKHVVMARHVSRPSSEKILFFSNEGKVIERTVVDTIKLDDIAINGGAVKIIDVSVGILDEPVPQSVRAYPLVGLDIDLLTSFGEGNFDVPSVVILERGRVKVARIGGTTEYRRNRFGGVWRDNEGDVEVFQSGPSTSRSKFSTLWGGIERTSTNPTFLVIDDRLVLLSVFHRGYRDGSGPTFAYPYIAEEVVRSVGELSSRSYTDFFDWDRCAFEGEVCEVGDLQTVRYGAGTEYVTIEASGSIPCKKPSFGDVDPKPNYTKFCSVRSVDSQPDEWVECANEGATCQFVGTSSVRYGADSRFTYSEFAGPILCANQTFGEDPAPRVRKACSLPVENDLPTDWSKCADEGATCNFEGVRTVRYGADGRFFTAQFSGPIECSNQTFGRDPAPLTRKACSLSTEPDASVEWEPCAGEWETCSFEGIKRVRYGAGSNFIVEELAGPIECTTSTFGSDPASGTRKTCFLEVQQP